MAFVAMVPLVLSFNPACMASGMIGMGLIYVIYLNFIQATDANDLFGDNQFDCRITWQAFFVLWLTSALSQLALFRHNHLILLFVELFWSGFLNALLIGHNDICKTMQDK